MPRSKRVAKKRERPPGYSFLPKKEVKAAKIRVKIKRQLRLDKIPFNNEDTTANLKKLLKLTSARKNPAPKIETLFYIRGVTKKATGKKILAGLWTGRGTLTTELAESAHYRDESSADETRKALVKSFPWIEWKVHSTSIEYRS